MSESTIKKCYLVLNAVKTVINAEGKVALGNGAAYSALFYDNLPGAVAAADQYARINTNAGLIFEVTEAHLTPILPMQVIRAETSLT